MAPKAFAADAIVIAPKVNMFNSPFLKYSSKKCLFVVGRPFRL